MTEFKFQWQKFKMESSAKEFLERYISRISQYADSHDISADLVDDIQQSILEKLLDEKWEITQKKLVSIVNSIWEPEDIFEDESDSYHIAKESKKENKSDLKPYERWQKTNWTRPCDKSILLWVCAMFGQATVIPTWIWRALTILWSWIFFAWWLLWTFLFWRTVYIILAIIFPIKDKDYKHCSMLKYRLTQIWDLRLAIPNFFSRLFWLCKWLVKDAIPSATRFLSKFLWPIWTFIKYAFLICRSLFLIFVLVGLWVLLYYLAFWFIKWNIDYTAIFPWITKTWVIFWIISAFILLLASIWALFKKKLSNTASLILAIWCGIIAVIIAVISRSKLYMEMDQIASYDTKQIKEKEILIQNQENPIYIDINRSVEESMWFRIAENRFISVWPTDDDKIRAVYTFNFMWKWEELTTAIENISDIDYSWNGNTLSIWLKNSVLFNDITPFVPTTIEIDLYIPKDLEFYFNGWTWLINIDFPAWAWGQASVNAQDCNKIIYNSESDRFFCELRIDYNRRYNIAMGNLKWMADVIVPLQWMNWAWSFTHYQNQNMWDIYWALDSIIMRSDSKILAKYSDKFFNFFVEIEYKIDNETWEFFLIRSQLQDVEQKWLMSNERMGHYNGWENLSGFEIQMKDDEKKNKEIEELNERIRILEERLNSFSDYAN